MLSFAHLLDADACPTCPTTENEVGQPVNPGMAGPSPTCPTCPTEKTAVVTKQDNGTASAVPAHILAALELGAYEDYFPAWTPQVCRDFLDVLEGEWKEFYVNGRHGLVMPDTWPPAFMEAVQSVYVLSLQGCKD